MSELLSLTVVWHIERQAPDGEPNAGEWLPCGLTHTTTHEAHDSLHWWRTHRPQEAYRLIQTTHRSEHIA